jgi:single-stranded DNA-specific DHH superfamily exonuclease
MVEGICRPGEPERLQKMMKAHTGSSGKGLLFYHSDADGACSAALFLRFFKGFDYSPRKGPVMGEDLVKLIPEKRPGTLVFLDLPVDQEWRKLERFLKEIPGLRIVIIDHHIHERDMSSDRVLHINPRFLRGDAYMPAACVVYRILEELGMGVKPLIWIAAMGVIGDYVWEDCPDLIRECREDYPYLLEGEPRGSRLGEGADTIAAATTLKGLPGISECLRTLISSQGFEDFDGNRKLQDWKRELDDEFQIIVEDFEKKRQVLEEENMILYELKSGLSLTSMVATHMGERFPDKIVAIRKASGDAWKVSLRGQNTGLNLGDIVKGCVKDIGSGGGHEKAAAAVVRDWGEFLKRLRRELVRASS